MVDDDRLPLRPGERPELRRIRFRTLGCYPLTGAVESAALTPAEIIEELRGSRLSERQGADRRRPGGRNGAQEARGIFLMAGRF